MVNIANLPLNEIPVRSWLENNDYFFVINDGQPYRIAPDKISGLGDWNNILNKPFDDIDLKKLSVAIKQSASDGSSLLCLTVNEDYLDKQIENKINDKIKDLPISDTSTAKISLNAVKTSYFTVNSQDMELIT